MFLILRILIRLFRPSTACDDMHHGSISKETIILDHASSFISNPMMPPLVVNLKVYMSVGRPDPNGAQTVKKYVRQANVHSLLVHR
jgi:hypothetical protein